MKRYTENRNYDRLARRGMYNPENGRYLRTSDVPEVGVALSQRGLKKAITMQLLVPGRNNIDSRTATTIDLNGTQARQIYETLRAFYSNPENNND